MLPLSYMRESERRVCMKELVSVIISTYKRPMDILERAIKSVKAQTYPNIEIILVNDYPEYHAKIQELMKDYADVNYICHATNMGACKARNDGAEIAQGRYIAFLDDDDEWVPTKIEKQVSVISKTEADMVYCSGEYHTPDGKISKMDFIFEPKPGYEMKKLLHENYMGGCSFPLIRKSAFLKVGAFDVNLPSSQDYDLWIRLLQNGKVIFLDEPLVIYYLQNDSISSNANKRYAGYKQLLNKHFATFSAYKDELAWTYKKMLEVCLRGELYAESGKIIVESFRVFPFNYNVLLVVPRYVASRIKRIIKVMEKW